ncbi:MAG: hypothetical protein RI519_02955, partial [Balneolaceae bacterium]|nr:hypothetical protein [Balneolaceae bacterium]
MGLTDVINRMNNNDFNYQQKQPTTTNNTLSTMNTFYSHFINKASALRLASMLSLMVIFFAVGVGAAYGQTQDTIFVSVNGSNSNTGQTTISGPDGPVATITYALSIATEGDLISIETGDYSEDVTVNASHSFRITDSGTQDSVLV